MSRNKFKGIDDKYSEVEAYFQQDYIEPIITSPNVSNNDVPSMFGSNLQGIEPFQSEQDEDIQLQLAISDIFKKTNIYDLVPKSTKIIVVDSQLHVKKVFNILLTFEMRGILVWNSTSSMFESMFTITDFLNIIINYNKLYGAPDVRSLENNKISYLIDILRKKTSSRREMSYIFPYHTISEAFDILIEKKIHRLPVIDETSNSAIFIITHKRIITFLYDKIKELKKPSYFFKTLEELRIGTYENVIKISYKTTINQVLHLLVDNVISALPIVDDEGKLVDIYSKSDSANLAADRSYMRLDAPIISALIHRQLGAEGVIRCMLNETFETILTRIVEGRVHRLIVVDNQNLVIGIISLSDILKFLYSKMN